MTVEDDAFWDRVVLLPFMRTISKKNQDKTLLKKLLKEKDQIATEAARCLRGLIRRNYVFTETRESRRLLAAWKGDFDNPIRQFVNGCCVIEEGGYVFSKPLYEAYREYHSANFADAPVSQSIFSNYIANRIKGAKRRKRRDERGMAVNGFAGLSLKTDWQKEEGGALEYGEKD